MMTKTEAQTFRSDHDSSARMLNRMSKSTLKVVYNRNLSSRGYQIVSGGPASKDELISAILAFEFPIAKLNESIHVLYHDEWKNDICEHCK